MKEIVFPIEPYTFTGSAVIIGLFLVEQFSNEELDSVGNWLQLVGLVMQTYSSQVALLESNQVAQDDSKTKDNMELLQKAVEKIQEQLKKLTEKQ